MLSAQDQAADSEPTASRVDWIVGDLQRQISAGTLHPGEALPSERGLCATFGVGRTTVREALKALLVQGYVSRATRGLVVAQPAERARLPQDLAAVAARASIRDLYEVRKLVEVRVARWSALRASADEIDHLREVVAAEGPGTDGPRHTHAGFHDALVAATHNPVLMQVYESSRDLFFRLPFFWQLLDEAEVQSARARRHNMAHRWHCQILDAIIQHDPDEAEGAMFQHLDAMEKDLLARLMVSPDHA